MKIRRSIKNLFAVVIILFAVAFLISSCGTTKSGCPGAITMGHTAHLHHA